MTGDGCTGMPLLVQAGIDGELGPADSARVAAHVAGCAACAALQDQLTGLSQRIRRDAPYFPVPERLRAGLQQRLSSAAQTGAATGDPRPPPERRTPAWGFASGFALAACLALALLGARPGFSPGPSAPGTLAALVVDDHIRALQPGHLTDVVSTDQHTVKPWFDGRVDFAPPVHDLAAAGFPLTGGRLDYIAGHPAAALIYRRRNHVIDVLVWPESGASQPETPLTGGVNGYHTLNWHQDGMSFWAVSDLNGDELSAFVRLFRG